MIFWKSIRTWVFLGLLGQSTAASHAAVSVYISDQNGLAWLHYACTAGELVRGFALDIEVDRGVILGVTNFLVGPSRANARGYGIFPGSFRDNVPLQDGITPVWNAPGYSPLAITADLPTDTKGGLQTSSVTLELGALWDPGVSGTQPDANGTLCALVLSQPAQVSVSANRGRGGVTLVNSDANSFPQFTGAAVGPLITSVSRSNGALHILFNGGELQTAPTAVGPWTGTGNTSGSYTETQPPEAEKFYRVHIR